MSEPVVLRPRSSSVWRLLLLSVAPSLVLVALALGEQQSRSAVLVSGGLLAVLVLDALAVLASRVLIHDGSVTLRRWLGGRTVIDRARASGVLARTAARAPWRDDAPRVLVVRSSDGGRRVRLDEPRWSSTDLVRIAGFLDLEQLGWVAVPKDLEERAPGTMRRLELAPVWVQAGLTVLGVAAVIGLLVAIDRL